MSGRPAQKGYTLVHQVQASDAYEREDLAAEGISEAEFHHANDLVPAATCHDSCHPVLADCDSQEKLKLSCWPPDGLDALLCWSWPVCLCQTLYAASVLVKPFFDISMMMLLWCIELLRTQVSAYAFGMELKPGERLKILMPVMVRLSPMIR